MNFLSKIENAINAFLLRVGALLLKLVHTIMPKGLAHYWQQLMLRKEQWLALAKQSPALVKTWAMAAVPRLKSFLQSLDLKSKFQRTYQDALTDYQSKKTQRLGRLRKIVLAPVIIISKWLEGLSATQAVVLMTFSAASFLAGIYIISSTRQLASHGEGRTPASLEDEVTFDRPAYYKEQRKHFKLTNMRLPVYVAKVNELKSVDVDFTAIVSNRRARFFLEKKEFQLRDHLISQMEPLVAEFPLVEEGKEVVRDKLEEEINLFLKLHNVEGHVTKLRLTYILAN
jgi:flagellar basal body-associated protein FliL